MEPLVNLTPSYLTSGPVSKIPARSMCLSRLLGRTACSSESPFSKSSTDISATMNAQDSSQSEQCFVPETEESRRHRERRARRDWRRRLRLHVISRLTDDNLRDLLTRPAEERDEDRNILDMETVRQYVPLEFEGRPVPDIDAPEELTWATEEAVKKRLCGIESIYAYTWSQPYNRTTRLVALWYGEEEPQLPEFLQDVPYFELRLGRDPRNICPQVSCKILCVEPQSISAVMHPTRSFGSLGFLGLLEEDSHNGGRVRHVGVTVGHILDDSIEDIVEVETDDQMYSVQLHPAPNFERRGRRRPAFRNHLPRFRSCFDSICLLEADTLSAELMDLLHISNAIDCNALFSVPEGIPLVDSLWDPALLDSEHVLKSLTQMLPLEVHKHGAATGQTTGQLVDIEDLEDNDSHLKQTLGDDTLAKQLVIEWLSPEKPFARDGDSGSLVYVKKNGKIVPLGIHHGSDEGLRLSYAYLLWSWCEELDRKLGLRLTFCPPGRCPN